jgi:hypothetical protein
MGTEFPLLLCGRKHGNSNSVPSSYIIIMYLKFQHDKHETGCAYVLLHAVEIAKTRLLASVILKKISGAIPRTPLFD